MGFAILCLFGLAAGQMVVIRFLLTRIQHLEALALIHDEEIERLKCRPASLTSVVAARDAHHLN